MARSRVLTDLVATADMGVIESVDGLRIEDSVRLAWGPEFSLGFEVETHGVEIVDTTGEVVGYFFGIVPEEEG